MPYTETEEFVCVGVALLCQETGYFNYKLEMKRRDRVTGFFPELEARVFTHGRRVFEQQLQHVHSLLKDDDGKGQLKLSLREADPIAIFKELVRPRESLFRFSGTATVLTENPAQELDRLYDQYVHRQFAQRDEYQEQIMAQRLQSLFRTNCIVGYKPSMFGDDTYRFRIPFVRGELASPANLRAIKPLNLTHAETTHIIDHGDLWLRRMRRLLDLNVEPQCLLLPVKTAAEKKRAEVGHGLCEDFRRLGVQVVEFGRQSEILGFAKAS